MKAFFIAQPNPEFNGNMGSVPNLKTAKLERLNKLFVGRELKMIELKEKIRELEGK